MTLTITFDQAKELVEDAEAESVKVGLVDDPQSDVVVQFCRGGVLAHPMSETGDTFLDMWLNDEL